jgi:hypothetical protein
MNQISDSGGFYKLDIPFIDNDWAPLHNVCFCGLSLSSVI